MRQIWVVLVALITIFLTGCNNIEHRSDSLPKKPLPNLEQASINPQLIWSTAKGSGVGKSAAKLRLALTQSAIITADIKGTVIAQNRKTGETLWNVDTKCTITGGPTIIENRILVGTKEKGLLAFDVATGQELWRSSLSGEALSAPKGNQGIVFVHTLDGSVAALNLNDGNLLWRHSLSSPPIVLRQGSSPAISGNHVLVGFSNGRLLNLDRMDGSITWEREVSAPRGRSDIQRMTDISADPIIKDGVVYAVSYQGRLVALSLDSGVPIWERDMSSYAGFTLSNKALFICDAKGDILSINRRSGSTLWCQTALEGRRLSKPQIVNNTLVVGDEDGYLHCLSMEDGSLLSRVKVDSKGIEAPMEVMDNTLYVLGRGGKVSAFTMSQITPSKL
jgi:outer membrane protein assembly factor BamB